MDKAVAVVLHDVAPATWKQCEALLQLVAELDPAAPVTLLLVPDFHYQGPMDADRRWCQAIEARIAHGDELALHGYYHLDEEAAPTTAGAWMRRRVLTAKEGEFSSLNRERAARRMRAGLDVFARLGWKASGFVAPAWQMSAGCRAALQGMPFEYTSTLRTLYALPDWVPHDGMSMSFSARSAWRRTVSLMWNRFLLWAQRDAPLVRVALHPADALHPGMLEGWRRLLTALLRERRAMTKGAWLREAHGGNTVSGDRKEPIAV